MQGQWSSLKKQIGTFEFTNELLSQINESINKGQRNRDLVDVFFASLDSPEVKGNVFDSGVVHTLVALLGERQSLKEKALRSLTKILRYDEKKSNAVVQAIPAIPIVINLLQHGRIGEKEIAIRALRPFAVARDETQKQTLSPLDHLLNAKVVKTLSSILCSDFVSLHHIAAEMLAIVLYSSTPEMRLEVEDEAIVRLMEMTNPSKTKEVRYFALNALRVINFVEIRRIMYGNIEFLRSILASMMNTTEKLEKCRATEIAHMLLVDDDDENNCKSSLLRLGVVDCLVGIVVNRDCLIKTRCKAMESLIVISKFPNFRENFRGVVTQNLLDLIKELRIKHEQESVGKISEDLITSLTTYRPPRTTARICPGEQPTLVRRSDIPFD